MPLRARLRDDAPPPDEGGSFNTPVEEMTDFQPFPEDDKDDVLFDVRGTLGVVQLNRPKKLHSLNGSMIRKLISILAKWDDDDSVSAVLITATGQKAFCAGGDVATLAIQNTLGNKGRRASTEYFAVEYKLNHLVATYNKPYIAIIDGITMGGGMGISCHGPFRVATEKTTFAMPETDIGLFPDVGGGFFLPRLDGGLGAYLALTAARVKGIQTYYSGIATHYVSSSAIPDLINKLQTTCSQSMAPTTPYHERLRLINGVLKPFQDCTPRDDPIQLAGETRRAIDEIFSLPTTVSKILEQLTAMAASTQQEHVRAWARKTHSTMTAGKSPTSMEVTLQQLSMGRSWSIAETFRQEYVMAARFMEHPDFVNGVKSKLVDKPPSKPSWDPPQAGTVAASVVDTFFKPRARLQSLRLLKEGSEASYMQYPHAWTALPSEARIKALLQRLVVRQPQEQELSRVVEELASDTGDVVAIQRKVEDVWARMSMDSP